uniref:transmembrane protein 248 isoform X2 n=1 Tax=Myxine glutinosa TaxID=7769 RepID=UPI00358DEAA7
MVSAEVVRAMVNGRPPLVMLMVTLSGFAIGFLSLGYFFKLREIKTPEVTQDWNMFLLHFNDLDFCMSENETLRLRGPNETSLSTSPTFNSIHSLTGNNISQNRMMVPSLSPTMEESGPVNISVMITLTLDPVKPFGGYSRNVTHLSATVYGYQIGLAGRDAQLEMNMTFSLPSLWGSEDCLLRGQCQQTVFYNTCLTITAAQSAFPNTQRPSTCNADGLANTSFSYILPLIVRNMESKSSQDFNPFWCYKGVVGKVYHTLNPRLSVIIPEDDRSLINLHLLHTSYFLFVMVITAFCFTVIRGRSPKSRSINADFSSEKVGLVGA